MSKQHKPDSKKPDWYKTNSVSKEEKPANSPNLKKANLEKGYNKDGYHDGNGGDIPPHRRVQAKNFKDVVYITLTTESAKVLKKTFPDMIVYSRTELAVIAEMKFSTEELLLLNHAKKIFGGHIGS